MSVTTYEATVENGQIKLLQARRLPEKTKVYVVVPDVATQPAIQIGSPRLTHPEQFIHFVKEVVEEPGDARISRPKNNAVQTPYPLHGLPIAYKQPDEPVADNE